MLCHLIFAQKKRIKIVVNDETLQIINKPKHQKKGGEYQEQNGRTHIQEPKRIT
jgi:hypothetical protein